MKMSISNIAWSDNLDNFMYERLSELGVEGLEIAPTRIFSDNPYDRLSEAKEFVERLLGSYGLSIPSMQSIWYGRTEKIWGSVGEKRQLLEYTKKAIDFASVIHCHNLVFGCPKNRVIPENGDVQVAIDFFKELGDYAYANNTCIGMEANPPIYNTNFINTTHEAIELIKRVDSKGFKLNLDVGTMIHNEESIDVLAGNENLINHVHISESGLKAVEKRDIHIHIIKMLNKIDYQGYISIEMGNSKDTDCIINVIKYLRKIMEKGE